jgi:mono/diheme cytochrome c family protein
MKIKFKAIASLALIAASTFILGSCTTDADSPGNEYMPDMYRSPAIEPYVDYGEIRGKLNNEVRMHISALTPPNNTIPYYGSDSSDVSIMLPYSRKANEAFKLTHGLYDTDLTVNDEYALSINDKNPIILTSTNSDIIFKSGKELFTANCAHCHGKKGDGNGPMVESGAYVGVPDYKNVNASEGQMFYSIYYGKGAMGGHSSILDKNEIWTLVHYVRKFQDSDYGSSNVEVALVADTTK